MKSLMENLQLVFGKSPGLTSLIGLKPSPICFSSLFAKLTWITCVTVLIPNALFSLNVGVFCYGKGLMAPDRVSLP